MREQGFAGGYSLVKTYVRTVRPQRQPALLTLAFAPGECAQVDWGSCGSVQVGQTTRRLSVFGLVLCSSRLMYVEFTVSQTMEHFLACHQHALEFVGGVPQSVMVDNVKSAVLTRTLGEAPVLNPKYADCATHTGFRIVPCNVGNRGGVRLDQDGGRPEEDPVLRPGAGRPRRSPSPPPPTTWCGCPSSWPEPPRDGADGLPARRPLADRRGRPVGS